MSAADRFGILIGFMSVMVAILSGMLRFLWKLSGILSNLATRLGSLEKQQEGAVVIHPQRRRKPPR